MKAKKVLYAAVGAPVVGYRMASDRVSDLRSRLNKEADSLGNTANQRMNKWASEGEKVFNRLSDAKVVDEFASRVDFDQVSTQVNKLRDQLEDLLATWRSSFRPEKLPTVKVQASPDGVKFETIPAKKATRRTTGTRKSTGAKKATSTKTVGASKPRVTKTTTTVKATATQSTATKAGGAKKAAGAKRATGAKKTAARKAAATKKVAVAS